MSSRFNRVPPDPTETVARLIRVYPQGSTSPALIETGSGDLHVLKFAAAGPGVKGLLTEYLATELARWQELRAPAARMLYLPPRFAWQIGTDEFDDLVQRSAGWNLGIQFIPRARDLGPGELDELLELFVSRLVAVDRLLQNVDRTKANPNVLKDGAGQLWAIDHGACLFLERIVANRRPFSFPLPPNHLGANRPAANAAQAAPRVGHIDTAFLRNILDAPPESWFDGIDLPRPELAERLADYFEAFRAELSGTA